MVLKLATLAGETVKEPDWRMILTNRIEPNDYNPNEMEQEAFEAIVAAARIEGMNQPVIVRPNLAKTGWYIIVDGENRWKVCVELKAKHTPCVVYEFTEAMAKARTISFNNLRGKHVPIKLARLLVDLHKEFSPAQVRAMTGVTEEIQLSTKKLLDVPQFKQETGPKLKLEDTTPKVPINVTIALLPKESKAYTLAMKKAMALFHGDVVALIGHECESYDLAMKAVMGMAGAKMRNVALACICQAFLDQPVSQQTKFIKAAHKAIYDKLQSDATSKAAAKVAAAKKS